jgi:hypothetical protein
MSRPLEAHDVAVLEDETPETVVLDLVNPARRGEELPGTREHEVAMRNGVGKVSEGSPSLYAEYSDIR